MPAAMDRPETAANGDTATARCGREAFSLVELLVVIAVIAVLLAILLPALSSARRTARTTICRANLKQFATAGGAYAVDFRNALYTFSWTNGNTPTRFADLAPPGGIFASTAHAIQATEIIRLRSRVEPTFPLTPLWCPGIEYGHLVLLDYLASEFPVPVAACPEDKPLLLWQKDIQRFQAGGFGAMQPELTGAGFVPNLMRAKPYSSSYETPPATYDRTRTPVDRLRQSGVSHYVYGADSWTRFGPARADDVAFPSQKVQLHDTHQRHYGRPLFFAHPETVQPILHFDSSVLDRKTADAGLGWKPFDPAGGPTIIPYVPYRYEPPTSNGTAVESFPGRYRWTRGGLKGIDFGPEITSVH
ncbi:MAG TPA: type II secretion system protein [Phycisphaerales bacterium]|nr:type II secretion system protein [Phycisphaerales bacterium]